jgi:hypothetical protein
MISTAVQLRLFDTSAAEVGSFYKPGDWVKIRKVPAIAKHVKCGHTYKIYAVEPSNGLLEFWNPFASQWDYLHPEEVKLALAPPAVDSVTPVEFADTESTLSSAVDSVSSKAQIADTEYTAETGVNDDSVSSKAQIADTEYTAEIGVNDDSVSSKAISIYSPRGTARSGKYFRFSYRERSRMRHIHIRGGNTDSPIAQAKVQEVRSLLAAGISPAEIAAMLKKT